MKTMVIAVLLVLLLIANEECRPADRDWTHNTMFAPSDWTSEPLVALLLCDPNKENKDGVLTDCVHYASKPYAECMGLATRMSERRRSKDSPIPACVRMEVAKKK